MGGEEAAEAFGLDPALPLHCLRGRLLVDGTTLSKITIFFPPAIGERLSRADFDDVVVFRSVERRLGIRLSGARITVTAERADAALARSLDAEEGDAVLVSRMLWRGEDDTPVELTIARHRAATSRALARLTELSEPSPISRRRPARVQRNTQDFAPDPDAFR